jgi:hypothetical protein
VRRNTTDVDQREAEREREAAHIADRDDGGSSAARKETVSEPRTSAWPAASALPHAARAICPPCLVAQSAREVDDDESAVMPIGIR